MARFGFDPRDFGKIAVQLGLSSRSRRRAAAKQDRRKRRVEGAATQEEDESRRRSAKERLSLIRTQFGATTSSEQKGKLGEPLVGRRRLSV